MEDALRSSGCILLAVSPPGEAPFRISFITPWGERIGIVAYAFTANSKTTKNRPADEHRFQVKYGGKDGKLQELWQDPFGLYTTLFLGINPELGIFVGADPVLNSPTRFFISKEFKQAHADEVRATGWHVWEREQQRRESEGEPREVLVGGTADTFLRYVLFEREAKGEDQGHRQLLAERFTGLKLPTATATLASFLDGGANKGGKSPMGARDAAAASLAFGAAAAGISLSPARLHALETEFALDAEQVLDLIQRAPRLKMAVRGWVAERHLQAQLERLEEVVLVEAIEQDGQPDFRVAVRGGRQPVLVECKNVLRTTDSVGHARLDFMRTRASPADPCSRYYSPREFGVLAACLHAQTEQWEFALRRTSEMPPHPKCPGKLHHRVVVDDAWRRDMAAVLREAAA